MPTVSDISRYLGKKPTIFGHIEEYQDLTLSTDTRTCQNGQIFLAIPGDKFDGHQFIQEAYQKGVRCFILQKNKIRNSTPALPDSAVFIVEDSVEALGKIAYHYKNEIFTSVVAITGSSGKTTTRELIVRILSEKYRVHTAKKNFNNEIGLPLTLLEAPKGTHVTVLEMGMNHPGEIRRLSRIAQPLASVITNVGYAHIGHLGSLDKIASAKAEIFEGMRKGGFCFLNHDDAYLNYFKRMAPGEVVEYGVSDLKIVKDLGLSGYELELGGRNIVFSLPGEHNLQNLAAALRVGAFFGIDVARMADAIEKVKPVPGRSEVIEGKIRLISDCYNANPSSMMAGLKLLSHGTGRRVAVLADMLELGHQADELHRQTGKAIAEEKLADLVMGYGTKTRYLLEEAGSTGIETRWFEGLEGLELAVEQTIQPGDTVLIKASNGMGLAPLSKKLQEKFAG